MSIRPYVQKHVISLFLLRQSKWQDNHVTLKIVGVVESVNCGTAVSPIPPVLVKSDKKATNDPHFLDILQNSDHCLITVAQLINLDLWLLSKYCTSPSTPVFVLFSWSWRRLRSFSPSVSYSAAHFTAEH